MSLSDKSLNIIKAWGKTSVLLNENIQSLPRQSLKQHLKARGEETDGSKGQLVQRLLDALDKEAEEKAAKLREAEHRRIADLEENGTVYCLGSNHKGQLGLGDLVARDVFTVIPETRGLGIHQVITRNDTVFAVSKTKVYSFGGAGLGVGQVNLDANSIHKNSKFESPTTIDDLNDEGIVHVSAGGNHVCALSEGGDVYVWGSGQCGCLGLGDHSSHAKPQVLSRQFEVLSIAAGDMHTSAVTNDGRCYSWGHVSNGRLGLGSHDNGDAHDSMKMRNYISSPTLVAFPCSIVNVTMVSCGSEHTIVLAGSSVFSWGCGDGGRLGHGDFEDRWTPHEIKELHGLHVSEISCGDWHSACVAKETSSAQKEAGGCCLVYTWGSGYHGELGHTKTTMLPKPKAIPYFSTNNISIKKIFCGRSHNAVITVDDELMTWGFNENNCLGHEKTMDGSVSFTSEPGKCPGFGTIVNRIGRGRPISVACGRGFTIVATKKYDGPTEDEARQLMEKSRLEEQQKKETEEKEANERKEAMEREKELARKRAEILFLTSKRKCTLCSCDGFQVHATKPGICRECGHSEIYHK